jgi:hypothetical protein
VAALVQLQAEQPTEEDLVGRCQQHRVAEGGEGRRAGQQPGRLLPGLPQVQPRVDQDAVGRYPGRLGGGGQPGQGRGHVRDHVVVDRVRVRHPWGEPHVGGHHGGAGGRGRRQEPGVGEAAQVVADRGSGRERGRRDRGSPGVDGQRHVQAAAQLGDGLAEQVALLGLGHLAGAHPGGPGADVQQVGAVGHQPFGAAQEVIQPEVVAAVVKGVGGAV